MKTFIISFALSWFFTLITLRASKHINLGMDQTFFEPRKVHHTVVPRLGSIPIFSSLSLIILYFYYFLPKSINYTLIVLTLCSLPVLILGLWDDITKHVNWKWRFLAAVISTFFSGLTLNLWLFRVDFFLLDYLLVFPFFVFFFTTISVTGVINSFNIIDGLNGLASAVGMIILICYGYLGVKLADPIIYLSCFALLGSILGFFVWNYPKGLIFLGDAGAYLIGFWIAELSILLVNKHHLSPWLPLLICFYPIFETLFTLYRRIFLQKKTPFKPDAAHLHQIIFRRIIRWKSDDNTKLIKNSMASPYLWVMSSMTVVPGLIFWNKPIFLKLFSFLFAFLYIYFYRSVVLFKTPKWLILKNNKIK